MEGAEELRETLVAMRQEIGLLRTEAKHANLLLEALDAMLDVDGRDDPFAGVFAALLPVFDCTAAIVLTESTAQRGPLKCIASNRTSVIGSVWPGPASKSPDWRMVARPPADRLVTVIS